MSTKGNRDFRPACHFAPKYGWINDPNGLFYENGAWHIFAQYNPAEPIWGPMHWLHAASADLLSWQEQGIALYPDPELGTAYSGSAVIDRGNTSGLGAKGDPVVLMYTHHGAYEQQSIAFSDDRVHFTPYAGNPVIPNAAEQNFRDPKVFRNEKKNCWTVVLAVGDHAEFHASEDLIHWRKTGEFGREENLLGGVFECTDLFPLTAPDGREVWVLVASMQLPEDFGSGRTQYFLGDFDGDTFVQTHAQGETLLINFGYDDYAAVSFHGVEPVTMIGWAASWGYARELPTDDFCCVYTYARQKSLVETRAGLRLAAKPITPDFKLEPLTHVIPPKNPEKREPPMTCGELPGELFRVRVDAPGAFALTLSNEDGEALVVTVDNDRRVVVDRTRAGHRDFSPRFASGLFSVMSAPRTQSGPVALDLYFDRMIMELYTDEGTVSNTSLVFPRKPYTKITLLGEGKVWVG